MVGGLLSKDKTKFGFSPKVSTAYDMDEYKASLVNIKVEVEEEGSSVARNSSAKNTNDDVQRAIEGLKEIPDEELQEFLDDEDFMQGLDVVDAWEGDEERKLEVEEKIGIKERPQRHPSRERIRRERKGSNSREKTKREERKREETRRDPLKSTKDIERDKIRAKRDNESKLLAEKERAIKNLLDSDNVVPPGTETEAIQSIAKQNMERAQLRLGRSKDRRRSPERQKGTPPRRRSLDRNRISPYRRRSPLGLSPERRRSPFKHRSPFRMSPEKRRSPHSRFNSDRRSPFVISPERRRSPFRRFSRERRFSVDRRWSAERHRRRVDTHDRRRSPSRERQRSRSMERIRRRLSRSPRRYSPRRRTRSRTRSRSRSRNRSRTRSLERRVRKRSPFINEIARQFGNEAIMNYAKNTYESTSIIDPILPGVTSASVYQQEPEPRPPHPSQSYVNQPPLRPPVPPGMPLQHIPPPPPPFMNFEMPPQPPMNFEPIQLQPIAPAEYSSGPVMYNQPNTAQMQGQIRPTLLPAPVPSPVPAPVPAPTMDHTLLTYNAVPSCSPSQRLESAKKHSSTPTFAPSTFSQNYKERRSPSPYNGSPLHVERIKTPEPPVISDTKQFEKTSLSSLLEASVSAKDSTSPPVLYPGFKPEILRHCEHALRELPLEDPRLMMKGRFFYNSIKKEETKDKSEEHASNSILLQKGKNKMLWYDEEEQHISMKLNIQMHQKICQTEKVETDTKSVQAEVTTHDFEMQVYPDDLEQATKEEKKPIMDRLDWNVRESYDYRESKYREADDLRWSLSNSSQRKSWARGSSSRRNEDHEHRLDPGRGSPPIRNRDSYSGHKGSVRDHYSRDRYSPEFRRSIEHDDYHEVRSNHSRGESPMVFDESSDELHEERVFRRESDWHPRGKTFRGRSSPMVKPHFLRGKYTGGRPYRGRGSYRGKF